MSSESKNSGEPSCVGCPDKKSENIEWIWVANSLDKGRHITPFIKGIELDLTS